MTQKTTAEWEIFIAEAKVEWEDFVARRPLRAVEELSSGEELEDDDSFESIEGAFMVYLTPDEFTWRETLQRPPTLNIKRSTRILKSCRLSWRTCLQQDRSPFPPKHEKILLRSSNTFGAQCPTSSRPWIALTSGFEFGNK
jgi:hypothetical protein